MKRFYHEVTVADQPGGYAVALDGRILKTQGNAPQIVPSRTLAALLAAEWAGQGKAVGDAIDPMAFFHRDIADLAIDSFADSPAEAVARCLRFGETDTLCYRAEAGEPLHDRQMERWEPWLRAAEARFDVRLVRINGILHQPQPAPALAMLERHIASLSPFEQAALLTLSSLAASLLLGLAALTGDGSADDLWDAANLEEDWQAQLWGWVDDAEELRARKLQQFRSAMDFAEALRAG